MFKERARARTRTGGRAGLEAEEPPVPASPVVPTPGVSSSEDLPPPFLGLVLVILCSSN